MELRAATPLAGYRHIKPATVFVSKAKDGTEQQETWADVEVLGFKKRSVIEVGERPKSAQPWRGGRPAAPRGKPRPRGTSSGTSSSSSSASAVGEKGKGRLRGSHRHTPHRPAKPQGRPGNFGVRKKAVSFKQKKISFEMARRRSNTLHEATAQPPTGSPRLQTYVTAVQATRMEVGAPPAPPSLSQYVQQRNAEGVALPSSRDTTPAASTLHQPLLTPHPPKLLDNASFGCLSAVQMTSTASTVGLLVPSTPPPLRGSSGFRSRGGSRMKERERDKDVVDAAAVEELLAEVKQSLKHPQLPTSSGLISMRIPPTSSHRLSGRHLKVDAGHAVPPSPGEGVMRVPSSPRRVPRTGSVVPPREDAAPPPPSAHPPPSHPQSAHPSRPEVRLPPQYLTEAAQLREKVMQALGAKWEVRCGTSPRISPARCPAGNRAERVRAARENLHARHLAHIESHTREALRARARAAKERTVRVKTLLIAAVHAQYWHRVLGMCCGQLSGVQARQGVVTPPVEAPVADGDADDDGNVSDEGSHAVETVAVARVASPILQMRAKILVGQFINKLKAARVAKLRHVAIISDYLSSRVHCERIKAATRSLLHGVQVIQRWVRRWRRAKVIHVQLLHMSLLAAEKRGGGGIKRKISYGRSGDRSPPPHVETVSSGLQKNIPFWARHAVVSHELQRMRARHTHSVEQYQQKLELYQRSRAMGKFLEDVDANVAAQYYANLGPPPPGPKPVAVVFPKKRQEKLLTAARQLYRAEQRASRMPQGTEVRHFASQRGQPGQSGVGVPVTSMMDFGGGSDVSSEGTSDSSSNSSDGAGRPAKVRLTITPEMRSARDEAVFRHTHAFAPMFSWEAPVSASRGKAKRRAKVVVASGKKH